MAGVITDGDLRRGIERFPNLFDHKPREIMTREPKCTTTDALAASALAIMEEHAVTNLVVFPPKGKKSRKPAGIIHIHDILKAGVG